MIRSMQSKLVLSSSIILLSTPFLISDQVNVGHKIKIDSEIKYVMFKIAAKSFSPSFAVAVYYLTQ